MDVRKGVQAQEEPTNLRGGGNAALQKAHKNVPGWTGKYFQMASSLRLEFPCNLAQGRTTSMFFLGPICGWQPSSEGHLAPHLYEKEGQGGSLQPAACGPTPVTKQVSEHIVFCISSQSSSSIAHLGRSPGSFPIIHISGK